MNKLCIMLLITMMTVLSVTACSDRNEEEYLSDTPVKTEDQTDEPADQPSETKDETDYVNEIVSADMVIGKWQYEDGSFTYELLEDGKLTVTGPQGTDDSCSWTFEKNNVVFRFPDDAGVSYDYDPEQDVLDSFGDHHVKLVRAD